MVKYSIHGAAEITRKCMMFSQTKGIVTLSDILGNKVSHLDMENSIEEHKGEILIHCVKHYQSIINAYCSI